MPTQNHVIVPSSGGSDAREFNAWPGKSASLQKMFVQRTLVQGRPAGSIWGASASRFGALDRGSLVRGPQRSHGGAFDGPRIGTLNREIPWRNMRFRSTAWSDFA